MDILMTTFHYLDRKLAEIGVDWQAELGGLGAPLFDHCQAMADLAGLDISDAMTAAIEQTLDAEQ